MNVENIDKVIGIMKRIPEDKFCLANFQSGWYCLSTEKAVLESCGTTCCVSGWIRVSPEFRELHNAKRTNSFSLSPEHSSADSIAELLDISNELASSLIFGNINLYKKYVRGITNLNRTVKPYHIINILEDIKVGKLS